MIKDQVLAALIYDILVIQTKGFEAQTNFKYSKGEIMTLLFQDNFLRMCDAGDTKVKQRVPSQLELMETRETLLKQQKRMNSS